MQQFPKRPPQTYDITLALGEDNIYSKTPVGSDVGSMSTTQLTERQKEIVRLIRNNDHISATDMSVVLSVVKRTIERELAKLQEMGVITHEGNTSAGRWVVL